MSGVVERPILFSGPMVRALLADEKTQTRRVVKLPKWATPGTEEEGAKDGELDVICTDTGCLSTLRCPYGKVGDRLWVRETFFCNHFHYPNAPHDELLEAMHYRADGTPDFEGEEIYMRWQPSIHMPRWASRLTLEITEVRVERLSSITEENAEDEGTASWLEESGGAFITLRRAYAGLWDQINGAGAFESNPWVWVVSFKRVSA